MGDITERWNSAWRDFATDGIPATGENDPNKAEIRPIGYLIERAINAAQAGLTTVSNIAARDAFYAVPANQAKLVYVNNNNGSATDPANGVYEYAGGSARLAASFYAGVASVVQPLVDEAGGYAASAAISAASATEAATEVEATLDELGRPTLGLLPKQYGNFSPSTQVTLDPRGYLVAQNNGGAVIDGTGLNYSESIRDLEMRTPRTYPYIAGTGVPSGAVLDARGYVSSTFGGSSDGKSAVALAVEKERLSRIAPSFAVTPLFVSTLEIGAARAGVSRYFRIPAGVNVRGDDHAFAEARRNSASDTGYISLAWAKRTGGVWGATTLLADEAGMDYHNPCPIYDQITGDLHLLWGAVTGGVTEAEEAGDPAKAGRMMHVVYRDGAWRKPSNNAVLTLPFKASDCDEVLQGRKAAWNLFYSGPGTGICMSDGFLIAPGWVRGADGLSYSIALRYDRMSRSWSAGGAVPYPSGVVNLNEATVAENDDGSLRINCRTTTGGGRVIATSFDQGRSWIGGYRDTTYPTPAVFESLLRLSLPGDGKAGRGLYYNVADPNERQNATIRFSLDGFKSYAASRLIYPTLTEDVTTDFEGVPLAAPVSLTHRTDYGVMWSTGPGKTGLLIEAQVVRKDGTVGQYFVLLFIEFNDAWVLEYS
ncbi:sialidase family protein [Novosphingobium lindaniclasticum]